MQATVRTAFKRCTVLTVAHRLHTIADCDRVLILDAGTVKEYDSPAKLLKVICPCLTTIAKLPASWPVTEVP